MLPFSLCFLLLGVGKNSQCLLAFFNRTETKTPGVSLKEKKSGTS